VGAQGQDRTSGRLSTVTAGDSNSIRAIRRVQPDFVATATQHLTTLEGASSGKRAVRDHGARIGSSWQVDNIRAGPAWVSLTNKP